jgi:uncharacterized protein (TIGR00369 family)
VTTKDGMANRDANGHSRCLFCGTLNPRSLNLSFREEEDGVLTTRFQAQAELQGYENILHGGVVAGLLDAAMTHCLFHRGVEAVTADLRVRFVRPVACTASVEIRAWVLSFDRSLYRLRAEMTMDGRVTAWAEAKFMRRRNVEGHPSKGVST